MNRVNVVAVKVISPQSRVASVGGAHSIRDTGPAHQALALHATAIPDTGPTMPTSEAADAILDIRHVRNILYPDYSGISGTGPARQGWSGTLRRDLPPPDWPLPAARRRWRREGPTDSARSLPRETNQDALRS